MLMSFSSAVGLITHSKGSVDDLICNFAPVFATIISDTSLVFMILLKKILQFCSYFVEPFWGGQ